MIRLRVPGSLTYRHLAVRVVGAACKMAAPRRGGEHGSPSPASRLDQVNQGSQSDAEFENQTVSAFGEAFNNIAIHGYRDRPPGDVDIEIESDEDGIVIRLMDTGQSFDPTGIATPQIEELPESGMGLFIIRSFMDEVDYHPGPPNILRLVKRRDGLVKRRDSGSPPSDEGNGGGNDHASADFSDNSQDHRESAPRGFRRWSAAPSALCT